MRPMLASKLFVMDLVAITLAMVAKVLLEKVGPMVMTMMTSLMVEAVATTMVMIMMVMVVVVVVVDQRVQASVGIRLSQNC
jgi:hypothetical protein